VLDDLKKYTDAIDCYDQVLKINPENADALNNKGVALAALGKYEEAVCYYNQFLKNCPKDVLVLVNKGRALSKMLKYTEALECFDEVLKINPDNSHALYNKGIVHADLEKANADQSIHQTLTIPQDIPVLNNDKIANNVDALYDKGVTLANLNRCDEAIACYDHILKINPDHADALSYKGVAYAALKNMKRLSLALMTFLKSIRTMNLPVL